MQIPQLSQYHSKEGGDQVFPHSFYTVKRNLITSIRNKNKGEKLKERFGERCCMCKRVWESVDHLLLYCDVAFVLWSAFFTHFGLSWVMPSSVINMFACWWASRRLRSVAI
jgi:hypothetical protein